MDISCQRFDLLWRELEEVCVKLSRGLYGAAGSFEQATYLIGLTSKRLFEVFREIFPRTWCRIVQARMPFRGPEFHILAMDYLCQNLMCAGKQRTETFSGCIELV